MGTIRASMHIHLDPEHLEALGVRGDAADVLGLAQELKLLRGENQLQLTLVTFSF